MKVRVECHTLVSKTIDIDDSIVEKYLASDRQDTWDFIFSIYNKIPNACDIVTVYHDDEIIYE